MANKSVVMVAIDFDDGQATKVLREASLMAKSVDAALEVVHVQPTLASYLHRLIPAEVETEVMNNLEQKAEQLCREQVADGIPVKWRIEKGPIAPTLLDLANDLRPRFLVLGAHKPSAQDLFIGSTAWKVLANAGCSVLVVR